MLRYEVKILVDSERTEDNLALYVEGLLKGRLAVEEVSVRPAE